MNILNACHATVNALQTRISIIILMIFQYHKHIIVKENEYNDCVPFRTFSPLTMTISFYLSIILCCESCVTLYLTFKKSDRYRCYIRCRNVVFMSGMPNNRQCIILITLTPENRRTFLKICNNEEYGRKKSLKY